MAKVTLRFLTRKGRVLRKTFNSISAAKRAVAGWRAKGGKMASRTLKKRRTKVLLGSKKRQFIHKSRGSNVSRRMDDAAWLALYNSPSQRKRRRALRGLNFG